MRKVTEKILKAFLQGKECKVGNTWTGGHYVYLHGNPIIKRVKSGNQTWICWTLSGWNTLPTRERINGLFSLMGVHQTVFQRDGRALLHVCNSCGDIVTHEIDNCKWYVCRVEEE